MRRRQIKRGDVTLTMNTQGPRTGPTLLFLHPGADPRSFWSPVFDRLRPRHWQLVAPDFGNCDFDSWEKSDQYHLDDCLAEGRDIIRSLKGQPVILVGSSSGGLMALLLAVQCPTQVDGLVLLDSPRPAPASSSGVKDLEVAQGSAANAGVLSRREPQLPGQLTPERISQALRSVAIPTLFLRGKHSGAVGHADLRELRGHIPQMEIADVDAGHLVAHDNPQAVVDRIAAFVPTLIRNTIH